jgi:hypothetical protein
MEMSPKGILIARSEFFRMNQSDDEIDAERQSDREAEQRFEHCKTSSGAGQGAGVKPHGAKQRQAQQDETQISHLRMPPQQQKAAEWRRTASGIDREDGRRA